jgi:hypothetical protein
VVSSPSKAGLLVFVTSFPCGFFPRGLPATVSNRRPNWMAINYEAFGPCGQCARSGRQKLVFFSTLRRLLPVMLPACFRNRRRWTACWSWWKNGSLPNLKQHRANKNFGQTTLAPAQGHGYDLIPKLCGVQSDFNRDRRDRVRGMLTVALTPAIRWS